MNQFKRAQVIMLLTEQNTILYLSSASNKLHLGVAHANNAYKQNQHLYIISDDEIKEKDWCIDIEDNIVFQVKEQGHSGLLRSNTDSFVEDSCKKIIATTDTLLINPNINTKSLLYSFLGDSFKSLPQPSQQFVEKYIESYNKGEVILILLLKIVVKRL
jgi:hypothetical protein